VNRSIQALAFAFILLGLTATRARAGLVIALSDVTLAPGNTGTMDITVTSNSSDTLSAFGLELQIVPVGTPASVLQFTTAQPDPYGNANYVFYNESTNADLGIPFWIVPLSPPSPFVTLRGGDSDDGSTLGYVTIPATAGGPNSFLAAVQFRAAPGAKPGDEFQMSLVSDPAHTYFDDQNGAPLTYTSAGGVVTIGSTVPEPSALTMMALACLSGLLCCLRGRTHGLLKNSPLATSISTR